MKRYANNVVWVPEKVALGTRKDQKCQRMDFPRVDGALANEIEEAIAPMKSILSESSFSLPVKPFNVHYSALISCGMDYFNCAVIPVQKRRILFGAFAALHRHFMSVTGAANVANLLPFGILWSHFSRTYFFLELNKLHFDVSEELSEIETVFRASSSEIGLAAFTSLKACFQKQYLKSKGGRQAIQKALNNFKTFLANASFLDRESQVVVNRHLRICETAVQSYVVELRLKKYVKKINIHAVRESIFPEMEPIDNMSEAMTHYFMFASVFLRVMGFETCSMESMKDMRSRESVSHVLEGENFLREFMNVVAPLARLQKFGDATALRDELAAYFETSGMDDWLISEKYAKWMRMRHPVDCNEIRPLFMLLYTFMEFVSVTKRGDVNFDGLVTRLLLSYSTALVRVKMMEDIGSIQLCEGQRSQVRNDNSFLGSFNRVLQYVRDLMNSGITNPKYSEFLKRFLISSELVKKLAHGVTAARREGFLEILKFIPDLRSIPDLFDFSKYSSAVETISAIPEVGLEFRNKVTDAWDWQEVVAQASKVYELAVSSVDEPSVMDFLEQLRKVVGYERTVENFGAKFLVTGAPRSLLFEDSPFVVDLTNFFEKVIPMIHNQSLPKIGSFTKVCFDLSLCLVFTDYSSSRAVEKRWRDMLESLAIPSFDAPLWHSLRYSEIGVRREGLSDAPEKLCSEFANALRELVADSKPQNVQRVAEAFEKAKTLLPATWIKQYERTVTILKEYTGLSETICVVSEKHYDSYAVPITRHLCPMTVICDLSMTLFETASFALSEGLVPPSMRDVFVAAAEQPKNWPAPQRMFLHVTAQVEADIMETLQKLQSVTFDDVQKKLSARCIVFSSLLVNFYALDARLYEVRVMFDELREKVKALETASDFKDALFEIVNCLTELSTTLQSWPKSFEIEAVLMTIDKFSSFIVDSLCVLYFPDDVTLCINALGRLRREQFDIPFEPITLERPVPASSHETRPVQSLEAQPDPERMRIVSRIKNVDGILRDFPSEPKVVEARKLVAELSSILSSLTHDDIVEQSSECRENLQILNMDINNEIMKTENAIRCLQEQYTRMRPQASGIAKLIEQERIKAHELEVAIEQSELNSRKVNAKASELEEILAKKDLEKGPAIEVINSMARCCEFGDRNDSLPLTEQLLKMRKMIGNVKERNLRVASQIKRAELAVLAKQANGEVPTLEEEEEEEAEGDFEDMTLFCDCDAKVKEMKELFDRAMRFHRKSMEKATTEMPRKEWELEMANVELLVYRLIEYIKEEKLEAESLNETKKALYAELDAKNEKISAVLAKL